MRHPVRKRTEASGRKDIDQVARVSLFRIFTGSFAGLLIGGLASMVGVSAGGWGLGTVLLVMGATWAIAVIGPLLLSGMGGGVARQIFHPSGSSTPSKREYSHAESLVARGLYLEAIDAFEVSIAEHPSDPTPYVRIARIYRDKLQRFEDSARWFKRALAESRAPAGRAYLATRELVELYMTKLEDPRRAAPLLARYAEEHAGTPEGEWAARELAAFKATIAREGPS